MAITLSDAWTQEVLAWWVAYGRILGFFMTAPWWGMRAIGWRVRVLLPLLLAWAVHGHVRPHLPSPLSQTDAGLLFICEWGLGLLAGGVMRLGTMALELMAEVMATQSGLGFAATQLHDNTLQSGLFAQLLGLSSLALVFVSQLHLLTLQWWLTAYHVWQPMSWPSAWGLEGVMAVFGGAFVLGVIWALPSMTVLLAMNLLQAILGRLSPQFNLFTLGFALTVSVSLVMLMVSVAWLEGDAWMQLWEAPLEWLRLGWS